MKTILKKYTFGFDVVALILFMAIMIPNFIWFAVPAPNDILRKPSITPIIDIISSVTQVLMIASLLFIKNKDFVKLKISPLTVTVTVFYMEYITAWIFYFIGIVNIPIFLFLSIAPCMAYLLYAIYRRNFIAVIPTAIFTVCHFIFALVKIFKDNICNF